MSAWPAAAGSAARRSRAQPPAASRGGAGRLQRAPAARCARDRAGRLCTTDRGADRRGRRGAGTGLTGGHDGAPRREQIPARPQNRQRLLRRHFPGCVAPRLPQPRAWRPTRRARVQGVWPRAAPAVVGSDCAAIASRAAPGCRGFLAARGARGRALPDLAPSRVRAPRIGGRMVAALRERAVQSCVCRRKRGPSCVLACAAQTAEAVPGLELTSQRHPVVAGCAGTNISTSEEVAIKLESVKSKHPQLLYE